MHNLKFSSLIVMSLAAVSMTMGTAPLLSANASSAQTTKPEVQTTKPEAKGSVSDFMSKVKDRVAGLLLTQDPSVSTLVTALKAANLTNVLSGHEPVTIFAPNNAAFAKLPPDTLKKLLSPEGREQLAALLKYHIVPVKIAPADIKSMKVKTMNGKEVDIQVKDSKITVNGANVVKNEALGDHGEIYVIDTVLTP